MAKKQIAAGLNGLLKSANPQEQANPATAPVVRAKTVLSFSVDETLAENIRYIAYYDRRKISAVITEALQKYVSEWEPTPQEKPRKF